MRLGAEPVQLRPGTKARAAYGAELIHERHRHRYEVSNALRPQARGGRPRRLRRLRADAIWSR